MTTTIAGYRIEIANEGDSIQCWVEKGRHSASLAALQNSGVLEDSSGFEHKVHPATIDRITAWAEYNGY